jgi:hypothetical protein
VHAGAFASRLDEAIGILKSDPERARQLGATQADYANNAFAWDRRAAEWEAFLRALAAHYSE